MTDAMRRRSTASRPAGCPAPRPTERPAAGRAHRGRPSRRSCSSPRSRCRAARSRPSRASIGATVDARLGDLEVALCATAASGCSSSAIGSSSRRRRRPARSSPATSAPTPSGSRRRRSRRWRSSPTGSPSRSAAVERIRGVDSDYTSGACCIAGSSWSSADPTRPAGRSCTARASSSSSGSA